MGETGIHVHTSMHLYGALLNAFVRTADVYVAANMFLYYEEGNPRAVKSPDVMVIKGVVGNKTEERRSFKTWVEQAVPCIIFEITSKATVVEDMVTKYRTYARLGVQEYVLFDPLHEYLDAQLIFFRLEGDEYVQIDAESSGQWKSDALGLLMTPEGRFLRLIDPETGEPIPDYTESLAIAKQEQENARKERENARQEAQRAEQEAQRAEQEAQRAEQEAQKAESERQRAEAAEAELARLQSLLEQQTT
jgi:hypothetical protein